MADGRKTVTLLHKKLRGFESLPPHEWFELELTSERMKASRGPKMLNHPNHAEVAQ